MKQTKDERDTLLNKIEGIASTAADDKRKAMERLKQKLKEKQQKLAVTESKVKDLQKWSRLRNASEAKIRTATDNLQVRKEKKMRHKAKGVYIEKTVHGALCVGPTLRFMSAVYITRAIE